MLKNIVNKIRGPKAECNTAGVLLGPSNSWMSRDETIFFHKINRGLSKVNSSITGFQHRLQENLFHQLP